MFEQTEITLLLVGRVASTEIKYWLSRFVVGTNYHRSILKFYYIYFRLLWRNGISFNFFLLSSSGKKIDVIFILVYFRVLWAASVGEAFIMLSK